MKRPSQETVDRWIDWVRLAQAGDQVALNQLLGELRPWIVCWAAQHCDAHLWEDVAQQVLIQVDRCLHQLRSPHALIGWVQRITRNKAWEVQRRWNGGKSKHAPKVVPMEDPHKQIPARVPSPLENLERQEELDQMHRGIDMLGEPHRSIVQDQLKGMSIKEISHQHGCPEGTIKQRLYTARQQLIKWMAV